MRVAACLIVKNEERLITEWLAFHRVVGFDTLIVYDNASTDQTLSQIRRFSTQHDVRCKSWDRYDEAYQMAAYEDMLKEFGSQFDWMLFIDADEFFVPIKCENVHDYLVDFEAHSAIAVNWSVFGSSGHQTIPNGLLIESFLRRAENDFGPNRHVKSLVRPNRIIKALNPHAFFVDGSYVDSHGDLIRWEEPFGPGVAMRPVRLDACRIQHYYTRSAEQWALRMQRGNPGGTPRTQEHFKVFDRNEIEDRSAARFAQLTQSLISCLPKSA